MISLHFITNYEAKVLLLCQLFAVLRLCNTFLSVFITYPSALLSSHTYLIICNLLRLL